MPTANDFQKELDSTFAFAEAKRLTAIVIKSGDLHHVVGNYPGTDHRMPICCNVMKKNMRTGDQILSEPPSGEGATLTIMYQFPSSNKGQAESLSYLVAQVSDLHRQAESPSYCGAGLWPAWTG